MINLKKETVQKILNYLTQQPYGNVAGLIEEIVMQVRASTEPQPKEEQKDDVQPAE